MDDDGKGYRVVLTWRQSDAWFSQQVNHASKQDAFASFYFTREREKWRAECQVDLYDLERNKVLESWRLGEERVETVRVIGIKDIQAQRELL